MVVVGAVGLAGLAGAVTLLTPKWSQTDLAPSGEIHPVWTAVNWPFPIDQWGTGQAFTCRAADCGTEVNLYLRAKIGFCDCTRGVADDDELERVSDVELVGPRHSALGSGQPIAVAWMKGRSRPYAIAGATGSTALAVAFNDRCDVIVATAVVGDGRPVAWQPAVIEFLNSDVVLRWAERTLGL